MEALRDPQPEETERKVTRIAKWLLHSNLFLGIGLGAMTAAAILLLRLPFNPVLPFISFSGCMMIYSLNRLSDRQEDRISLPERYEFIRYHGGFMVYTSVVFFGFSLLLSYRMGAWILAVALMPQTVGVLYSWFRLKRFFLLKNLAVVLALTSTLLIVIAAEWPVQPAWMLLFGIVSLSFFINVVISDIKDVAGDAAAGIQTLPLRLGVRRTRAICTGLLCIAAVLSVPLILHDHIFLALVPYLAYIGYYTRTAPAEGIPWWYYGMFVDGEFLVLLAFTLLLR